MLPILAQAVPAGADPTQWMLLAIPAAFFALIVFIVIAAMRQERWKAAQAHAERIKRLEMGVRDAEPVRLWPAAVVCTAIGAVVPVSAFALTLVAYLNQRIPSEDIWVAPVVVSLAAVVGGVRLARQLLAAGAPAGGPEAVRPGAWDEAKPVSDPDAFDVVGRRG